MRSQSRALTLDQVTRQFEQWRAKRKCKGPTPDRLWALAIPLIGHYSAAQICRSLRISYAGYQRYLLKIKKTKKPPTRPCANAKQAFIQLPHDNPALPTSLLGSTLEILRTDGLKLTVQVPSTDALGGLINQLLRSETCYK